jgi:succinate-semialdehyde dehydrogenase / glutarate-semialdehyde dehydrogenase
MVAKAAAIMRARVDEFAKPVTLEMGKLIAESRGEVELSADIIDYYAKNAESFPRAANAQAGSGEAVIESTRSACSLASSRGTFPTTSSRVLPRPI